MPPDASLNAVPNGKEITLEEGQSLAEAATQAGLNPRTVWEHPNNAALREARPVPLHLRAGDTLFLPAIIAKEETVAVNARHVFKRHGIPAKYRAQVFTHDGQARAQQTYSLKVDGQVRNGRTDDHGVLEVFLPPGARRGVLRMDADGWEIEIRFSAMAPRDTILGAQMRLFNLGYLATEATGCIDEPSRLALIRFQVAVDLPVTCEFDQETMAAIARQHDQRCASLPNRIDSSQRRRAQQG